MPLDHPSRPHSAFGLSHIETIQALGDMLIREIKAFNETRAVLQKAVERGESISLLDEVRAFEVKLIRSALIRAHGKQRTAAQLLGLRVTTLNAKIKKYKIELF